MHSNMSGAQVVGDRGNMRTLGFVKVVRHGDELRAREIVREGLALCGSPGPSARDPRLRRESEN